MALNLLAGELLASVQPAQLDELREVISDLEDDVNAQALE